MMKKQKLSQERKVDRVIRTISPELRGSAGLLMTGLLNVGLIGYGAVMVFALQSGERTRTRIMETRLALQNRAMDTFDEVMMVPVSTAGKFSGFCKNTGEKMAWSGDLMITEQVSLNECEFAWANGQNWLHTGQEKGAYSDTKTIDLKPGQIGLPGETELIIEAQCGELESFNGLVLAYQGDLFNIALFMLGDDELAADATQKAFILAFRNINGYCGGSFKSWLMRIVINACYDEMRYQKRHPTISIETSRDDGEENETPATWLVDASKSPEEKLETAELAHIIQQCLITLPIAFRTVIVLIDVQGMNYREAASIARIPLGTVKSRLGRARMRMREQLQAYCEFLPATYRREKDTQLRSRFLPNVQFQ